MLARIRHPGMPEVMEVGEVQGRPYLVMEYIGGGTLAKRIAKSRSLSEAETLSIAESLASVLAEIHRHGIVHRDVKPENILLTESGEAKLMDFGLAAQLKPNQTDDEIVGTFLYTAPEQTGMLKVPVDGRADLYSLGVVLFECLTGSVPFQAADTGEVIRRHAVERAPAVKSLKTDVSSGLSTIVGKLLAKDPDDRFESGDALLRELHKLRGVSADAGGEPHDAGVSKAYEPRLVGRSAELSELITAWRRAQKGQGGFVLIEGDPGAGKSRLARELFKQARSEEGLVLSGKCALADPVPYAPLRTMLDGYLRGLKRLDEDARRRAERALIEAAGDFAPYLKQFSKSLATLFEDAPDPEEEAVQNIFASALAEFFLRFAQLRGPTILFIDDLQWLDDSSRSVVKAFMQHVGDSPLLLVTTARSDAESADLVARFTDDIDAWSISLRLHLTLLSEENVGRMISDILGGAEVEANLVKQVAVRSGGIPFAVGEYVQALLDHGVVRPAWGVWRVDDEALEGLQLPTDIVQLIIKRIGGLSAATREVLSTGAVFGSRFSSERLHQIFHTSEERTLAALNEVVGINLIERDAFGEYTFIDDRVREAFLAELTKDALRGLNQRIAESLDATADPSDPEVVYALARHYAAGDRGSNPRRVYETNLAAGLRALADFANEEAYLFLQNAKDALALTDLDSSEANLEGVLGEACARTGRVEAAHAHLNKAIELAQSKLERAKLRMRIADVHLADYNQSLAWKAMGEAYGELGRATPGLNISSMIGMVWYLVLGMIVDFGGIGRGSVKDEKRESFLFLARLNRRTFFAAYFHAKIVAMMQGAIFNLYYSSRLGPSPELCDAYCLFGMLCSDLSRPTAGGLPKLVGRYYARRAAEVAEKLGQPEVTARTLIVNSWAAQHRGESLAADDMEVETLYRYAGWMEPFHEVNAVGDLGWNLLMRGKMSRALKIVQEGLNRTKSMVGSTPDTQHFRRLLYTCTAWFASALGKTEEAAEAIAKADELGDEVEAEPFRTGDCGGVYVGYLVEQDEYGPTFERKLDAFLRVKTLPSFQWLYIRHGFVLQTYGWMRQYMRASADDEQYYRAKFKKALWLLMWYAEIPVMKAHYFALRGAYHRMQGRHAKAERYFVRAERLARQTDNTWASYEVARQRAHSLREQGNLPGARHEARVALFLALDQGWVNREREIRSEFELIEERADPSASGSGARRWTDVHPSQSGAFRRSGTSDQAGLHGSSGSHASSRGGSASSKASRQLNALLQVSLASAGVFDPKQQARIALDSIVRILGAERAFLFLVDDESGKLAFEAGRDAQGHELAELKDYSSTVVNKVYENGEAVVVSGTEEGALLGSESAVVHELRSIMAAPLMLREELVGVVYLDNHLARGLFTQDDVQILTAMANHIAVGLEIVHAATLEVSRRELQKDLAVTAAVQTMLLPKEESYAAEAFQLAAAYRPAAQSGGDWWWKESRPDGSIRILVGDVTGHGAGSAMVTAAIAGSYHTFSSIAEHHPDVPKLFEVLNTNLHRLTSGQYGMSLTVVEVNPASKTLRMWNAGSPPPFLLKLDGNVKVLSSRGSPLGTNKDFSMGTIEVPFESGDRLMIYTDGLSELATPSGRQLGLKRLAAFLRESRPESLENAKAQILRSLEQARAEGPLEDDLTMVLLDRA